MPIYSDSSIAKLKKKALAKSKDFVKIMITFTSTKIIKIFLKKDNYYFC